MLISSFEELWKKVCEGENMGIIGEENVSLLVFLSLFFGNKNYFTCTHNKIRFFSAVKFSLYKSYIAVANNAAQGNDNDTLELRLNACCA